jgi:DNA-binding CsgD family transcriptional regulator
MTVLPLPCSTPQATRLGALAPLVGAIGAPDFSGAALRGVNESGLPAASWSVYELRPDQLPVLHLSSSVGVADTTQQCFAAYLDGLYRRDRSFDAVRPGHAAVLRMHADEAPSLDHREAIYLRHGMLERLSVVQRTPGTGALLAVNLYRHQHQGRFGAAELAGFAELAPLLLAAVQRHLSLAPVKSTSPRETLHRRCPALTQRELDVCERLLRGWSYDGIAADLGLSLATIKTYRARAFERLGLHFKSELFAACRPLG